MTAPNPAYPVRVDVDYPDRLSRLLIFVKWLLAFPHYIALFFLAIGASVVLIISWFATIIMGSYPAGMFDYMVGVLRWGVRVSAYVFLMTDSYPPFSLQDDPSYPVRVEIDYPQRIARWRPLLNWLLVIPVALVAAVIGIIAYICVFIAWFAILITGRMPQGMFDPILYWFRWSTRTAVFEYWMTEQYPPFVWA
ncbi:MAG TPA: DUF4389 domain-containing protein [Solirubrobacteraceae bacterium]|nr:DUF4389 domain-containing protein [Solirubrobacteraceae bacterium]